MRRMGTDVATATDRPEFRGRVYDSIADTIGATPLVRIHRLASIAGVKADILARCEFFNPFDSVKDRIGVSMIAAAEAVGQINPGPCWSSRPRAIPESRSPLCVLPGDTG